jgi:TolB-like protein
VLAALATLTLLSAPRVVAVHYFDNRTGDGEWDMLCKGVADMLVTDLAQVPGLTLVERERLEAALAELKLQRTQWFDPKSTQQVGKLLGAQVMVTGQFLELKPDFVIEARALEVGSGKVVASVRVKGTSSDFFALELELANALASGLVTGSRVGANAPTDADTALEYAKALDEKDRGDLAAASRRMSHVVRAAPDFRLGKQRSAELLAFLARATEAHDDALAATRAELEQRLAKRGAAGRGTDPVCTTVLQSALAAGDLRAVVGEGLSEKGINVLKKSVHSAAKKPLDRLAELGAGVLDAVTKQPLSAGRIGCRGTERDEADFASLGVKLPPPALLTRAAVLDALVRLLAFGETPAWSGASFRVSPAPAVLDPAARARADQYLTALRDELLAPDAGRTASAAMGQWTDLAGQVDVLFGRQDAAIEKWQAFLTRHSDAPTFAQIKRRLELLLGTTPEAQDFAAALPGCASALTKGMSREVQRVGWAEGAKGLERLMASVEAKCKGRREPLTQLYVAMVSEAAFWSECALLGAAERKLAALEPNERHAVFADVCVE